MNHNQNEVTTDLRRIEQEMDQLIRTVGLKKAVVLLEHFNGKLKKERGQTDASLTKRNHNSQLIFTFLVSKCSDVLGLNESEFHTSNIPEYREGRMICYYLLHTYSGLSYSRIGELFSRNKRHVLYFCNKCEQMLSLPRFYRSFASKYAMLDKLTFEFLLSL